MTPEDQAHERINKIRSRIERALQKHGAGDFAYQSKPLEASVLFSLNGQQIRYTIGLPRVEEFEKTPKGKPRPEELVLRVYYGSVCAKWRALELLIKAKLIAITDKVVFAESEFLAATVTKSGATVGEHFQQHGQLPQIGHSQ